MVTLCATTQASHRQAAAQLEGQIGNMQSGADDKIGEVVGDHHLKLL